MISEAKKWLRQPLLSDQPPSANRVARTVLLLAWLAVTAWLASNHVPWRDEARAWSLMLMADGWIDLFRVVQGEGHPYLWYIILKAGHALFGVKEVLPATGLVIAVAIAALLSLMAPFRLWVIAALLFSVHIGYEFSIISRNYGIAALIMLGIAWQWARIRDSLWLGLLLLLLANTNVPSLFLAGAIFLYRLLELWGENRNFRSAEWRRLLGNAGLLGLGALFCFLAVYPPANESAAAARSMPLTISNVLLAIFSPERTFFSFGFGSGYLLGDLLLLLSFLLFARTPSGLFAALAGLLCLKLFFFFVYPGYYRHSALFFILLVTFVWIEADKRAAGSRQAEAPSGVVLTGAWSLGLLLLVQSITYLQRPVAGTLKGLPHNHAADLARILDRPEFKGSMLMIDPDTMGESVVYQTGRPYWLIRQDRPGTVTPLLSTGIKTLTLDDLLEQAERVHQRTGRPVVIALALDIDEIEPGSYDLMFNDYTVLTPESVARFKAATRPVARLRKSRETEEYDVFAYPR